MKNPLAICKTIFCFISAIISFASPVATMAQMAEGPLWTKTDDGEIFKAFDDELERTVGKLKLGEHPAPYFVSFHGVESKYTSI